MPPAGSSDRCVRSHGRTVSADVPRRPKSFVRTTTASRAVSVGTVTPRSSSQRSMRNSNYIPDTQRPSSSNFIQRTLITCKTIKKINDNNIYRFHMLCYKTICMFITLLVMSVCLVVRVVEGFNGKSHLHHPRDLR